MNHYAIGDVHGEYETLMSLVEKLPGDAKLYFVGDLIDRGPESRKVVDFVRDGNHRCALGNHEDMMITEAIRMREEGVGYRIDPLWAHNGGVPTLLSYGILEEVGDGEYRYTEEMESMERFIADAEWMETLPLAVKAPLRWREHDIVVSHASLGDGWEWALRIKRGEPGYDDCKNHAIWNRNQEGAKTAKAVFNIFGHTPRPDTPAEFSIPSSRTNWRNIDSGCAYDREGFGKLTAIDLETMEIVQVRRRART